MSDPPLTTQQARQPTAEWWLLLLVGGLSFVVGVIVLAKPSNSLTTLAVVCGVFVLIDSIVEVATSLFAEHSGCHRRHSAASRSHWNIASGASWLR